MPGVVTVDMTRMDRVLSIDKEALVARVEAGIYGPQLEEALQAEGFTLGHYPQSFEFSTLGGWIAPRSAGHQSNKYGKAEQWTVSARLATPNGFWTTASFPGSAAGPQLRDMVAGSEGILGIITEAEVRIERVPDVKDYRGYVFAEFAAGVAATREMMQEGVPTAMIRLSDLEETHFYHALHSGGAGDDPVLFCLMLVGIEGDEGIVAWARERSRAIIERHGGMHMGEELGEVWYKGRFEMPYLRDPMMDRGLGVDTLETATRWSNLVHLHDVTVAAIKGAMAANMPSDTARGICLAHVSHSYRDGASLYFTFAFPRALDREVGQWLAIKKAASDTIVSNGGTISHHHGVGVDHLPWIAQEKGEAGMVALRAVKRALDPRGILNPGKLLD
ncbi:MAG: FAD-binding oxidoreductase [bacterium]|nr:FAD-binding oxidoreductase [bacterium]